MPQPKRRTRTQMQPTLRDDVIVRELRVRGGDPGAVRKVHLTERSSEPSGRGAAPGAGSAETSLRRLSMQAPPETPA